jgi:hypothetical protein
MMIKSPKCDATPVSTETDHAAEKPLSSAKPNKLNNNAHANDKQIPLKKTPLMMMTKMLKMLPPRNLMTLFFTMIQPILP